MDLWYCYLKFGVFGNVDLILFMVKFFSDINLNWNVWREWFDMNERGGIGLIIEVVFLNFLYYVLKFNLVDIVICFIR